MDSISADKYLLEVLRGTSHDRRLICSEALLAPVHKVSRTSAFLWNPSPLQNSLEQANEVVPAEIDPRAIPPPHCTMSRRCQMPSLATASEVTTVFLRFTPPLPPAWAPARPVACRHPHHFLSPLTRFYSFNSRRFSTPHPLLALSPQFQAYRPAATPSVFMQPHFPPLTSIEGCVRAPMPFTVASTLNHPTLSNPSCRPRLCL